MVVALNASMDASTPTAAGTRRRTTRGRRGGLLALATRLPPWGRAILRRIRSLSLSQSAEGRGIIVQVLRDIIRLVESGTTPWWLDETAPYEVESEEWDGV